MRIPNHLPPPYVWAISQVILFTGLSLKFDAGVAMISVGCVCVLTSFFLWMLYR